MIHVTGSSEEADWNDPGYMLVQVGGPGFIRL